MSVGTRITPRKIRQSKGIRPLVCLTAAHAPLATIVDRHVDLILVGDSLGMVLYGYKTTLPVSLEMMTIHARAVVQASKRACVIVDLPFSTYEESPVQAYRHAAHLLANSGASGVKVEGGTAMADTIAYLTKRHIPVMAHIGLQPQSCLADGGFYAQGRSDGDGIRLMEDARAVSQAGAFAVVAECIVASLADQIRAAVCIPVIGIGSSRDCDGQILVTEDILGLGQQRRFVKAYAQIDQAIDQAVEAYAGEVRRGLFPTTDHAYPEAPGQDRTRPQSIPPRSGKPKTTNGES